MNPTPLPYLAALDGLRAVSILLVAVAHFGFGKVVPGGFGVTIFFFISGFIITRMLMKEVFESQSIDLKSFYIRRFFRLGPALIVFVLICWLASLAWKPIPLGDIVASLLYLANYWGIYHEFAPFNPPNNIYSPLGVLWSLAVEEHFYFFFPLLTLFFANRLQLLLKVIIALCVAILLWRVALLVWQLQTTGIIREIRTYKATDTRIDSILFGCLLSVWRHLADMNPGSHLANLLQRFTGRKTFLAGLVLLALCLLIRNEFFRESFRYSLQGIGVLLLFIPLFVGDDPFGLKRWLGSKPMVYIGNISYSFYLYHWLVVVVFLNWSFTRQPAVFFVGGMIASIALADMSYRFIETPLRRYGHRLAEAMRS
jgi:peptidoglycan/LPS O-acetylase OafA/YrhL